MVKKILLIFLISISFYSFALDKKLIIKGNGKTVYGEWNAECLSSSSHFTPGKELKIKAGLYLNKSYFENLKANKINPDEICILITAERTFDYEGRMRFTGDEKMSTILTSSGLAIEGGIPGAATKRFGFYHKTPLDIFTSIKLSDAKLVKDTYLFAFNFKEKLPSDLPPGIYRLRFDFGVKSGKRILSLNNNNFSQRTFNKDKDYSSYLYSPVIPADGINVYGVKIKAADIKKIIPWVILFDYNSNGYKGETAQEDKNYFALSSRNIIQDEVILPLYDDKGKKYSYSLEPQFPTDSIDQYSNIKWDYTKGEIGIIVNNPDGSFTDLGTASVLEKKRDGVTTKKKEFYAWQPKGYGQYTVKVTGWTADIYGNKYYGGGTYKFWIANRLTMATATFQGMPYPVGTRYGRDILFMPGVPADVEVNVSLYVNSDKNIVKTLNYSGKASKYGLFGAAQGLKPFNLDAPGEYFADILAKYTDKDNHLWVCSMKHAGVVYPPDTAITAHGKKMLIKNNLYERGSTNFEGHLEENGDNHLAHIDYPYNAGDMLLIASEQEGQNKIEPVLTYQVNGKKEVYDKNLSGIGRSNVIIKTSNEYAPHMFPEYITSLEYFYGSAPRPGFMSRFIISDDGIKAPYWPTSRTNFGGQFGASNNGDTAGDIYRLLGGVVIREKSKTSLYAGYIATSIIIPGKSNNNRVVEAGSEELTGSDGKKGRFFLTGLRPGSTFEVGSGITAAIQIDPILPVNMKVSLVYPDDIIKSVSGIGDNFGTFVGNERWVLDKPGVYYYRVEGEWNGYKGYMPGLPKEGGQIYVFNNPDPTHQSRFILDTEGKKIFSPTEGFKIKGRTTASEVYYSVLTPGAVIAQGVITVKDNAFEYFFNPVEINKIIPIYDIVNTKSGKPDIGRIIHLSFFAKEKSDDGKENYEFKKIVLRGTKIVQTE